MRASLVIVEDDPCWCDALKYFFNDFDDFSAMAYTDPWQAWSAISVSPPDLAFLDVVMPSLSGNELAEKMREQGLRTKIIFMTGLMTLEETRARDYKIGNQTVVGKPTPLDVLLRLARQSLDA